MNSVTLITIMAIGPGSHGCPDIFKFHDEYAVKVQRSLAPLSRFRGSHIPSAHEQQCCRFQSYANSVRSPMKFTSEIYIA